MEAGFKATHKGLFMQLHKTHTYIWMHSAFSGTGYGQHGWMEEKKEELASLFVCQGKPRHSMHT